MVRLLVSIVMFFVLSFPAVAAMSGADIIKRVEENLNGKTARLVISMTVKTKRAERSMRMESLAIGKEKSFIRITYPKKDAGTTFLKVDRQMWQYVPRIEKIIKIPASMMLQSWMGSDFTNDDLVKESSISEDYTTSVLGEAGDEVTLELIPRPEAAVVWGRVVMGVSRELFLPTRVEYYDEDGALVRVLRYLEVKSFAGRSYPSLWIMDPKTEDKVGHQTIVRVEEALFDEEISSEYFTKRALKRFSK